MSTDKIDAKLNQELERLERGEASDRRLSVIVEPARDGAASSAAGMAGQDERARGATDPLRQRLAAMGVGDVQVLSLTPAVVASLTPAQIRSLAADPQVKRITWNALEKVTL